MSSEPCTIHDHGPVPSTDTMPDHSICMYCGLPISWDEYTYTHDDVGWADCGVIMTGGQIRKALVVNGVAFPAPPGKVWRVNPDVTGTAITTAQPVERLIVALHNVLTYV